MTPFQTNYKCLGQICDQLVTSIMTYKFTGICNSCHTMIMKMLILPLAPIVTRSTETEELEDSTCINLPPPEQVSEMLQL